MNRSDIPWVVDGTRSEELDDELLLYFEDGRFIVALNQVASVLWGLCDGQRTLEEIEGLLVEIYPDAGGQIPADLAGAVSELVEVGVLELLGSH